MKGNLGDILNALKWLIPKSQKYSTKLGRNSKSMTLTLMNWMPWSLGSELNYWKMQDLIREIMDTLRFSLPHK